MSILVAKSVYMEKKIFYSWQSDLPNSTNRGFIQACLEEAIKELKNDQELQLEIALDRDTDGVPGSPDIGQTIFSKIDLAAVFVSDVSIIQIDSKRPSPNPNVLLELGYAFKNIGSAGIIMVMNTNFGKPELLPFDLKQKRIITYNVPEGADKSSEKKRLIKVFLEALKTSLVNHEQQNLAEESEENSKSNSVIKAIESNAPNKDRIILSFMRWIGEELKKLDPHFLEGEPDDLLVEAINKSALFVKEFDRVADAISANKDTESGLAVVKGFEYILSQYYLPIGYSGQYSTTDFDFFKFVGHEMFTILFAYIIRDERWMMVKPLLGRKIYVANGPNDYKNQEYSFLSVYLYLLDEIRAKRLANGGSRRTSIQADLLKERHESGILAENLNWQEFKDSDLFLFFYSFINNREDSYVWWPRTAVYFGWGDKLPRFLDEAKHLKVAETLLEILNVKDIEGLRKVLSEAKEYLAHGMRQSNPIAETLRGFNAEKIGSE